MGTERHGMARSGADARERQQELLHALHAAMHTLSICVARIEELIGQVDRQMSGRGDALGSEGLHAPAQVSFGGGASVISSRDIREGSAGSDERRRGVERRADIEERRSAGERRVPRASERPAPGTPALMAATEMAHLGYSREEIAERLRARWGDRAAAILREALD